MDSCVYDILRFVFCSCTCYFLVSFLVLALLLSAVLSLFGVRVKVYIQFIEFQFILPPLRPHVLLYSLWLCVIVLPVLFWQSSVPYILPLEFFFFLYPLIPCCVFTHLFLSPLISLLCVYIAFALPLSFLCHTVVFTLSICNSSFLVFFMEL